MCNFRYTLKSNFVDPRISHNSRFIVSTLLKSRPLQRLLVSLTVGDMFHLAVLQKFKEGSCVRCCCACLCCRLRHAALIHAGLCKICMILPILPVKPEVPRGSSFPPGQPSHPGPLHRSPCRLPGPGMKDHTQ